MRVSFSEIVAVGREARAVRGVDVAGCVKGSKGMRWKKNGMGRRKWS